MKWERRVYNNIEIKKILFLFYIVLFFCLKIYTRRWRQWSTKTKSWMLEFDESLKFPHFYFELCCGCWYWENHWKCTTFSFQCMGTFKCVLCVYVYDRDFLSYLLSAEIFSLFHCLFQHLVHLLMLSCFTHTTRTCIRLCIHLYLKKHLQILEKLGFYDCIVLTKNKILSKRWCYTDELLYAQLSLSLYQMKCVTFYTQHTRASNHTIFLVNSACLLLLLLLLCVVFFFSVKIWKIEAKSRA